MSKILVTGAAGFIGFHLTKRLIDNGHDVTGLDSLNEYYDINLKYARLTKLGIIKENIEYNKIILNERLKKFRFIRLNIADKEPILDLFEQQKYDIVFNLAAQAGVRYSITNPYAYIESNIVGFMNILEGCRHSNVRHLIYASSSSVYGNNTKIPFSESDRVDSPVSIYASTKVSNEMMAFTYSHLYNLRTTGLRFFTVYGPWGRPDMAIFLFTKAALEGTPIGVFNKGNLKRDFTYIDDIVRAATMVVEKDINDKQYSFSDLNTNSRSQHLNRIFNIGFGKAVSLIDFINSVEKATGREIVKNMLPMQAGDVHVTWSDCSKFQNEYGFKPKVAVEEGVKRFVDWYIEYSKYIRS